MFPWRPRCCRSTPRCRSCPLRLRAELRAVDALAAEPEVPPHLAGVPSCLHRYEPLLRRLEDQRVRALPTASAPDPARAGSTSSAREARTAALPPAAAGAER